MDNIPTPDSVQEQHNIQPDNTTKQPKAQQDKHKLVVAAFVVTILAWVAIPLQYVVSICLAIIGLAFAVIGVRQPRSGSRNLALVTLVAAAVLLLVYAIFWSALLFVTFNY